MSGLKFKGDFTLFCGDVVVVESCPIGKKSRLIQLKNKVANLKFVSDSKQSLECTLSRISMIKASYLNFYRLTAQLSKLTQ